MPIPKIIHQTAPTNKDDWHPIWRECQESWKRNFADFEYVMWNDNDIDSLVMNKFPEYWNFFQSLPFHIMQLDFVRFCILYEYGGIYADMDMYCYKNFYEDLFDGCYLVETDDPKNEIVQNSLMASNKNNYFFKLCMDKNVETFIPFQEEVTYDLVLNTSKWNSYVLKNTGPKFLSKIYNLYFSNDVNILPREEYNPGIYYYDDQIKTKHMLTGRWGKDMITNLKQRQINANSNLSHKEFLIQDYFNFRNINVHNFNFEQDYTKS